MTMLKFVLCAALVLVSAEAMSKDKMEALYEKLLPHITECSKEFGLADGELKKAKQDDNIDAIDSCFFACVFKKIGMIGEDGKFDPEKSLEKTKEHLTDEADLKSASEVVEACVSVNSEDVSDGDAGCERAKLLVSCLHKNKDKFLSP
ncbi:uncharacterized protein LOC126372984 [Pectinophora gossypiella]|uniref:uncharacterized protein LOC126372984 n=1 Tax=Pectinophora gossypiella TaxID=13191 RepID=UPI00214E4146|nr:uncharacterized protein LOC126372984 [Pectinophora gossypiella]